jgi:hypothetical protein
MGLFNFVSSSYKKIAPKYCFQKKFLKIEFFGSNFFYSASLLYSTLQQKLKNIWDEIQKYKFSIKKGESVYSYFL